MADYKSGVADYKAIVTGGARGIGHAITSALLEAGGKVCFFDVSASEGEKAQKSFDEKYGSGKAVFLKCDVSKKNELHDAFHQAKSQMRGLNVVCNNAGVMVHTDESSHSDELISINLGGVINGSMLALELMGRGYGGNGGVIINTASLLGLSVIHPQAAIYSSTKAGIIHFTRCIAQTSPRDHGVRVNCICPHAVYTNMTTSLLNDTWEGRLKPAQEIADYMPKNDDEAREMYLKTTDISNEVMKLINDESKNGQVLAITKNPDDRTQVKVENVELK
ncbi:15-hydroxyprostaglandin dehydrogenase [NAD(+)]-like [Paramuricea clavata]|uniref:15-hydroxyprostaglandin dehydrogenase [NAD(+)] n=1 Tax=Paramuricea clavata TaxID=317549 RepID=A0A6S7G1I0_PARCT|nr:15-hydroxyprostaglandin dehydrogenase [NAD(+)]-like [Paramuricea clavata]